MVVESFGPRHVTPEAFNALLIEIIGLASLQFCREKDAQGLTREQINQLLPDHLAMLDRWRGDTLREFIAFVN
jgi:hypothetical protein